MNINSLRSALGLRLGQVLTPEVATEIESASLNNQPPWVKSSREAMLELMNGNEDAVSMLFDLAAWSHTYDDLIDKDKPVSDFNIHQAMWILLAQLPLNPFFRAHEQDFRPLLMAGIMNWHAANQMQASGCTEQLRIAHAIRYSGSDIAYLAMMFTGGVDHAIANASKCRLMMQYDTWANYSKEHAHVDSI